MKGVFALLLCGMALTEAFVIELGNDLRREVSMDSLCPFGKDINIDAGEVGSSSSSGILKGASTGSYRSQDCTVTISPPNGYGIVASIRTVDLKPGGVDELILSSNGADLHTFSNFGQTQNEKVDNRESEVYISDGPLKVTLKIKVAEKPFGNPNFFNTFTGFQLTYTAFKRTPCGKDEFQCLNNRCIAKALTCHKDKHNHCGDRSEYTEEACNKKSVIDIVGGRDGKGGKITIDVPWTGPSIGTIVGIIFGVIVLLAVIAGLIAFLVLRRKRVQGSVVGRR